MRICHNNVVLEERGENGKEEVICSLNWSGICTGMVTHTRNPRVQEAAAGGAGVQLSWLYSELEANLGCTKPCLTTKLNAWAFALFKCSLSPRYLLLLI